MELFVDTLEREIEFYLESANPNIILDSNKINQLISSNIFPNLMTCLATLLARRRSSHCVLARMSASSDDCKTAS